VPGNPYVLSLSTALLTDIPIFNGLATGWILGIDTHTACFDSFWIALTTSTYCSGLTNAPGIKTNPVCICFGNLILSCGGANNTLSRRLLPELARTVDSITLDKKLGDIVNAFVVVVTEDRNHDDNMMKKNSNEDMFDVDVVFVEFFGFT
jgi:hypothetical protein